MTPRRLFASLLATWSTVLVIVAGLLFVAWNASVPVAAYAVKGASTDSTIDASPTLPPLAPYAVFTAPQNANIQANEYALYNPESGKTLFQSTDMSHVAIASTTKLMTAYLVASADKSELDTVVTISSVAADQPAEASMMGLVTGEKITLHDLLYGALLVSGDDAAEALAEVRGGELLNDPNATPQQKAARFVKEMNTEAATLHMDNTHYLDAIGLDDNGYSTAVDLTKIATLVAQDPVLKGVIGTSDIHLTDQTGYYPYTLHNSNRLLADQPYAGIIGGKTGYTDSAGHCLVAIAQRGNITLVAVILNTFVNSPDASANEARKLLDVGFQGLTLQ